MRNDLTALQKFVDQTAVKQPSVAASLLELEKAKMVAAHWEKTSPHKRELSALYQKINILAQNVGMTVQRLDPQPGIAHARIYEVPVTVAGSGTFAQVYEFLRGVEELPMVVWAKSVKLEKNAMNAKEVQCQMELVVFANKS